MGIAFDLGKVFGRLSFLLSSLFKFAIHWLRQFFMDLWHGSVKWQWFAVLLGVAVGVASVDEFGAAIAIGALAIVSIASNYWHWAARNAVTKSTRILTFPVLVVLLVLLFFEVKEIKGVKPWSHLPKAWDDMLIA